MTGCLSAISNGFLSRLVSEITTDAGLENLAQVRKLIKESRTDQTMGSVQNFSIQFCSLETFSAAPYPWLFPLILPKKTVQHLLTYELIATYHQLIQSG